MPSAAGPILRILGLMIELIGITMLMLSGRRDGADAGGRPGVSSDLVWGIIVLGFLVWAAGTTMIYAQRFRPRRKDEVRTDPDDGP